VSRSFLPVFFSGWNHNDKSGIQSLQRLCIRHFSTTKQHTNMKQQAEKQVRSQERQSQLAIGNIPASVK